MYTPSVLDQPTDMPGRRATCPIIRAVVVLPLVPAIATTLMCGRIRRGPEPSVAAAITAPSALIISVSAAGPVATLSIRAPGRTPRPRLSRRCAMGTPRRGRSPPAHSGSALPTWWHLRREPVGARSGSRSVSRNAAGIRCPPISERAVDASAIAAQAPVECRPPSTWIISPVVLGKKSLSSATTALAAGVMSFGSQPNGAR
jgi:hypothetical protein